MIKHKILITGGYGFIGHHFVKLLADESFEKTVLDNNIIYDSIGRDQNEELIKERIKWINADHLHINKDVRFAKIDKDFDTIVHMAQVPRQHEVSLNPNTACDILLNGLYNVLEGQRNLKHLIFISTSMVYGDFTDNVLETIEPAPKSQYGMLRLVGEKVVKTYCKKKNIKYTIIRPSAVYGPRDTDNRIVGKFFSQAMAGEDITLKGADQILDFTYVEDLVKGIRSCMFDINAFNQTFNMTRSNVEKYTIGLLAKKILSLTGSDSKLIYTDRDITFPQRSILSIEKARTRLGYDPKIDLDDGLEKTYEWIKSFQKVTECEPELV